MINELLVNLVNSVLGTGKRTARGNQAYTCPFCNHHKPKLEVNLTENREGKNPWHCWACDVRGTTIYNLFKQLKTDNYTGYITLEPHVPENILKNTFEDSLQYLTTLINNLFCN